MPNLPSSYLFAQANTLEPQKISVILLSPENITYTPNNLRLTFRVSHWTNYNIETWFTLDNQAPVRLSLSNYQGSLGSSIYDSAITGLKDGSHVIKIRASNGETYNEAVRFFTIDSTSPTISNISIENKTYTNTDLTLNYTINEQPSWVAYSLDNKANVTINSYEPLNLTERLRSSHYYQVNESMNGHTVLINLTKGSHSLIIYANDTVGNIGASQTITFTVDTPESFSTTMTIVAVSVLAVILIGVGLLVYYKKKLVCIKF